MEGRGKIGRHGRSAGSGGVRGRPIRRRAGLNETHDTANAPVKPRVYLSDVIRYEEDAREVYGRLKELCASYGLEAVTPCDWADGFPETESASIPM